MKKHQNEPKNIALEKDIQHDNYWTIKENKQEKVDLVPKHSKAKGPMIHFDLSSIAKNKPGTMAKAVHVYKDGPAKTAVIYHKENTKSGKSTGIVNQMATLTPFLITFWIPESTT